MEGADGVAVCRALRRAAMIWGPPRTLQHPERHSLERTLDQLDISQHPHDIAYGRGEEFGRDARLPTLTSAQPGQSRRDKGGDAPDFQRTGTSRASLR